MAELLTGNSTSRNSELRADLRTLLLAQKTELIAELTQATANQFNNIMMAITGYAELEMKKVPAKERRSLEQVLSNAVRATDLVQKLLAMSRKHTPCPQQVDLNHLLTESRSLLEQFVGEHASVLYNLDPSNPAINADPFEIEQVVLSLAISARNAMSRGGTLTASTKMVELTRSSSGMGELDRPGHYVMLSIEDTGSGGVSEEPGFESADSYDQDSRINLSFAVVRGVVQSSQGFVRFSTQPGKGNSFKIYFPALQPDGSRRRSRHVHRNLPVARTVLVVEDDEAVLVPTTEFLKMEGFKVLQARTGAEAIRVVQQNRSSLDVLITDILMPEMTGREVAKQLLDLHPGLRVLFMSGDESAVDLAGDGVARKAVLRKPFRLDKLKDKIHELLGE
jgi:two-component system, cell cycle sensor histidine kinase and response regulator CckA